MTQASHSIKSENIYSDFLKDTDWQDCKLQSMGFDMGYRKYFRLDNGERTCLLMDMSKAGLECGLDQYVQIDEYLASLNIRVPALYKYDLQSGFSIIEDLGSTSFGDCLREGMDRKQFYPIATKVLIELKDKATQNDLDLVPFDRSTPRSKLDFFAQYYIPAITRKPFDQNDLYEFNKVLDEVQSAAHPCAKTAALGDYHLENLIWMENEPEHYAVIDFQDAFWVQQPYDLVNLLEDARQDVPKDIKRDMYELYCENMSAEEKQGFDDWYIILSMIFHIKVLGQLVKYRKERGRKEYDSFIPRLQNYLKKEMEHPLLKPMKNWLSEKQVHFDITLDELFESE